MIWCIMGLFYVCNEHMEVQLPLLEVYTCTQVYLCLHVYAGCKRDFYHILH